MLGEQLSRGVALQNSPIEEFKKLAELRDRAFTVFVRAYGQVQHALQYLRRERNDADRYAPSLYGRRRSRKAKALADAVAQNADAQPSAVAPGASTQPSAIAPSANTSLLVATVPERHQETPNDADAPHVSASATVPPNASAVAPRVHARHKQRRAKRAASRRRLQRKAAKRGDSDLVE